MCFGLTGCGNSAVEDAKNELEEAEKDLQETYEKYGLIEEETVEVLVAKFNKEVADNSSLNPASEDYLTVGEDSYWYGLIEGVYLVVVPEEFSNDKATEIVDYMALYVDKTSQYASDSLEYAKHLIKANNSEITDAEIDTLLADAKASAADQKTANNGKGISVGYIETDEDYQYQVIRLYK